MSTRKILKHFSLRRIALKKCTKVNIRLRKKQQLPAKTKKAVAQFTQPLTALILRILLKKIGLLIMLKLEPQQKKGLNCFI